MVGPQFVSTDDQGSAASAATPPTASKAPTVLPTANAVAGVII